MIFCKTCEDLVDLEKRWKMRPLSLSEVPNLWKIVQNLNAKILFNEPIIAPVKKNQVIGKLILFNDKEEILNSNLISGENIEKNNFFGRTLQKIEYLIN